jgi:hypothetical protein
MGRGRVVVFCSFSIAAAGMVAAMAAVAARTAEPTRPSLPAHAAFLPAESTFVMGLDVKRLVASPLYQRFKSGPLQSGRETWSELERRTGLIPERDLDQMLMAGTGGRGDSGIALVTGSFQQSKVEGTLAKAAGVSGAVHKGRKVWTFEPGAGRKTQALSVVDDGAIVAGPLPDVHAALDRHESKAAGLKGNPGLSALVEKVTPGVTFWMCGDQGLVSAVGNTTANTAGWTVPAIKTLVISGDLDPDIRGTILAGTADDAGAKGVADMARGLMGLLAMQATKRPELQDLASGIDIAQQGSDVKIGVRLSYETFARLQATPTPRPVIDTPVARPAARPRPSK